MVPEPDWPDQYARRASRGRGTCVRLGLRGEERRRAEPSHRRYLSAAPRHRGQCILLCSVIKIKVRNQSQKISDKRL